MRGQADADSQAPEEAERCGTCCVSAPMVLLLPVHSPPSAAASLVALPAVDFLLLPATAKRSLCALPLL